MVTNIYFDPIGGCVVNFDTLMFVNVDLIEPFSLSDDLIDLIHLRLHQLSISLLEQ